MNPAVNENEFTDLDRHFARFIHRIGGGEESVIQTAAARLSRAVREGHICLDLRGIGTEQSGHQKLLECSAIGTPDDEAPLILDNEGRLYLRRYWLYEKQLASLLRTRTKRKRRAKSNVYGTQEEAVAKAISGQLTVITGGPGTGKTTTVVAILRQLIEQSSESTPRIALAAPTGKAAARLEETVRAGIEKLSAPAEIKAKIPCKASTIHRLLGSWRGGLKFFYDRKNPLPLDILVVDEASMVALPLMAKLFDALPENARVILLGDRDQLASVEPGAVLADIVEAAMVMDGPLQGALLVLSKNYRFGNENAIFQLSSAVRAGDSDTALQILGKSNLQELGSAPVPTPARLGAQLETVIVDQYKSYLNEKEPAKALAALQQFRVVSALREGPFGVKQINKLIEGVLHRRGLITDPSRLYAGQPILVTQNDYQARLFNGDVGIVLPDPEDGTGNSQLWAWFIGQDNELRRLSSGRLPEYELAYAMTVHKSQGSEFDRVLLILPDRDSPVLTRELIYTGVTRASKRVDVWFNEEVFRASVTRKAVRASGLRDALTPNASAPSVRLR
jgi:exodeoxyribonuclease V alpha subunit